jgi:hypothetical protein
MSDSKNAILREIMLYMHKGRDRAKAGKNVKTTNK